MKARWLALATLVFSAVLGFAVDSSVPAPAIVAGRESELFLGYSRTYLDTVPASSLNGGNLAYTYFLSSRLGVTADGDASVWIKYGLGSAAFRLGPTYRFTNGRIVPFVDFLTGYEYLRVRQDVNGGWVPQGRSVTASGLTYGGGGGVDVRLSRGWAVRAAQIEIEKMPVGAHGSQWLRLSFGAVYRPSRPSSGR
jgi:hypothetical protein